MGLMLVDPLIEATAATEVAGAVAAAGVGVESAGVLGGLFSAESLTRMAAGFLFNQAVGALFGPRSGSASSFGQAMQGTLINGLSTVDPIQVIFGTRRMAGSRVLTEVTGTVNQILSLVIVWGEGPISAVRRIYLDG